MCSSCHYLTLRHTAVPHGAGRRGGCTTNSRAYCPHLGRGRSGFLQDFESNPFGGGAGRPVSARSAPSPPLLEWRLQPLAEEAAPGASAEKGEKLNLPVVILLGWAGCKDRYLEKYSTIYLQKGCVVIRYTAPWRMVFFSESLGFKSLQNLAKNLLEVLFDYKLEGRPVLFHVFSNGGFMLYRYIVKLLHTDQQFQHLKVVGTVFDSAPGRRNLTGGLRALSVVLEPYSLFVKYSLLLTFAVIVVTLRIMLYPLTRFVHETHYDAMLKQLSGWPELYLYSKADPVIRASDVENMIEARRQHQVLVKAVDFMDSGHVSHLRAYPTSYMTNCTSFMYSCIGST